MTLTENGSGLNPERKNLQRVLALVVDLLAISASFAGRLYGLRSRKRQALVDCAKQVLAEQEQ